ncbi:hypothetical protein DM01DRAFT_1293010 [Hesseltinella vesiculosa]|uniref:ASX DEUBAD domain-containing protein n=1 Tax=Hesseltinella vesiculosa TaxID=101127 RepID=A0A1X2G7P5_9FUNG|nr:hypothetical protein DM01DRAFT_1293010 [Hesseltinella vesiculosa]
MFDVHTPFKRFKQEEPTLDYLLTDPTSALANIKLETVFNIEEFQHLPTETQNELTKLLPMVDVALPSYSSSASSSSASLPLEDPSPSLHPSFFSKSDNPIFWSVLDDWQTMLSNGDMLPTTSTSSITPSTLSNPSSTTPAPPSFKDEAFETYWGELNEKDKMHNVAGDSKSITLKDMCRKGLIRENDIIVYKRNFSACKVIVSKSMKVVKADGTLGLSIILDDQIFEDFETPTALETKILDQHGKVSRDRRPNGNAFKSIRLIRNGKDLGRLFDIRKDAFGS